PFGAHESLCPAPCGRPYHRSRAGRLLRPGTFYSPVTATEVRHCEKTNQRRKGNARFIASGHLCLLQSCLACCSSTSPRDQRNDGFSPLHIRVSWPRIRAEAEFSRPSKLIKLRAGRAGLQNGLFPTSIAKSFLVPAKRRNPNLAPF